MQDISGAQEQGTNPTAPTTTPSPQKTTPPTSWQHFELWGRIVDSFQELPKHFRSTISVSGIAATEIYTFGAVLGATIEEEVVRTLNNLRDQWDPTGHYADYLFVRQPQTFPDLVFTNPNVTDPPLIGVELKSWYILAKEGEPSLRFLVTPSACTPQDLFVVVPWVLSNVLSGTPLIYAPFVEPARFIAEYRNYYWQHLRSTTQDTTITPPAIAVTPYPTKSDLINDVPAADSGGNFGRIARTRLMDSFVNNFKRVRLLGIFVDDWRGFFKKQVG